MKECLFLRKLDTKTKLEDDKRTSTNDFSTIFSLYFFMTTTTIRHILKAKTFRELVTISPEKTTYEALQLMAEKEIGSVAVMEGDQLIGILTERDYARKIVLHGKASRNTPVGEIMHKDFPVMPPSATIDECMQIMTNERFRYIAVKENDNLLGIISIGDVVKSMIAEQQANIDHLERYITGR